MDTNVSERLETLKEILELYDLGLNDDEVEGYIDFFQLDLGENDEF